MTLSERRRLLKLTGWQIKSRVNPSIEVNAHLLWDYARQTATIEFREKFNEETQDRLLWHELAHIPLLSVSVFLKEVLTAEEFEYYERLEERAVTQFANALNGH